MTFFSQILLSQRDCSCVLCVLRSIYYLLSNSCPIIYQQWAEWDTTACPLYVFSTSTRLYEKDKCIGYWLSPMPTSTSIHPFAAPSPAPALPPARPGIVSVWQALGPSGDQWAVTGSSSASLSLQSGARWGLVREPRLPKWPHCSWDEENIIGHDLRHFHFASRTTLNTYY